MGDKGIKTRVNQRRMRDEKRSECIVTKVSIVRQCVFILAKHTDFR